MLRKLSVVITFFAFSGLLVFAQQTPPTAPKPPVGRVQSMALGSLFEGGYLGAQMKEISKENFSQYGLREVRGVAVDKVVEDSPAERAGLQNGDVIVRFDGTEVTSIRKMSRLISEVAPDHQANLTVIRNGSEIEIKVTMGRREFPRFENSGAIFGELPPMPAIPPMTPMPNIQRMPRIPSSPAIPFPPSGEAGSVMFFGSNRHIGITVTGLTKQLGEHFGVAEGRGVLISGVREKSPANKAGLQAGDVIVEVDGKEVKNTFDLTRLINERKEGAVNLTVIRNKARLNISVEPEKSDGKMRIITPDGNDGRMFVSPKTILTPGVVTGNTPGIIL